MTAIHSLSAEHAATTIPGRLPDELWAVEITYLPTEPNPRAVAQWREELEMTGHPDPAGQEFFWPTVSRVYRSRSGARARLSIFESYGARGRLVRTTPQWAPAETKDQKIARLEARLAELGDPQ